MPLFKLIDGILHQFRICFKREETFNWFVIIVFGMLLRTEMRGISTIIGTLYLESGCYETMLHFFRSKAYDLKYIKSKWQSIVLEYIEPVMMDGYAILVGDHIKVSKEARHMPGVKKLHHDSENAGKAEYIFGHQHGMLGILADSKTYQCIPLDIELQDGIDEITCLKDDAEVTDSALKKLKDENNSIMKMIQMARRFVRGKGQKAIVLLDAFFTSGDAFDAVEQTNQELGAQDVVLITRAKANTVAYEEPDVTIKRGRGRPKKYGKKITFKNVFNEMVDTFQTATLILYGKEETVKYICMDLIWKPFGRKLRFVLVKTNEKCMILACSDLYMHPERIIVAYSYRFKIEVSFKMLKHVIGGFCYHFWTAAMPKLSRFKTCVDLSKVTEKRDREKIVSTIRAVEVFSFMSCIAMGILTIISLQFPNMVWGKFTVWLRTRSSQTPSIETVRSVLQHELWRNNHKVSSYATLSNIQKYQNKEEPIRHRHSA
ncbi:MAG: transposase [Clostridia bacterium]|nr:transposase [Clostridia bacterium]